MQCVNCGRPLRPDETICPNCGEPVLRSGEDTPGEAVSSAALPFRSAHPSGPPVDPYAPTIYGPPVGPDRYAAAYSPSGTPPASRRVTGYTPVQPLPPLQAPRRRSRWLRGLAAASALCLVILLFVGALAASGQRIAGIDLGFGRGQPTRPKTLAPTATAAPNCPAPAVDPRAAQALSQIQLSTGVRDAAHDDLRPVDNVSSFSPGQYIYVTFQVTSNDAGTIVASFCATGMPAGSPATKIQNVPAGYMNAHGEFHLQQPFVAANAGPGLVLLQWNEAVAAVLPFTVRAH
jgi:hypothetical protein